MNKEETNMTLTMRNPRAAFVTATLAAALLSLPTIALAAASPRAQATGATAQTENPTAAEAASRLDKKQFHDVKVNVENGIATLTGSVDLYEYKADAEKRIRHAKGVSAVRNQIEVAGPTVSDKELQTKLAEKLTYDRVGYGNAFNAITVSVQNGVVTLSGHARTDVDKDSALALASTYPGVKEVVGEIEVDPVSIMDDRTRMEVARAVYGYPTLSKYSVDPAKPIRISVQNGNVELYGTVDSQADKDVAYMRANAVPGIFSVKNYLQVAGQPSEAQK
jgi:osmotically-inducible protein OsmY